VTILTIFRGEAEIARVPLTGKTMKLGRGKDNDIVLDDPGKGVSRVHAELRPEGNHYRLVDLQSQNGTWVSGQRVPSVLLAPGVVAAMGPFRVAINASSPVTQALPINREDSLPETEFSRPIPPLPPAAAAEPLAVADPNSLLDGLAPGQGGAAVPPAPESTIPSPAPPRPPAAATEATARRPPAAANSAPRSRALPAIVGALVLVAASAFAGYKLLLHKAKPQPVWDATAAAALVDSGRCGEALDQQINPALAAQPDNAQALALKAKCTAPPPPPSTTTVPPVVVATNTEKLDAAEAALQASSCQAALDAANEVLAADANDERAQALVRKATDCLKPAAVPAPTPPQAEPAVRIAAAQGGLDPLPGENGKEYKARVAALRKRYDDAVALLQAQHNQQALRELDAIAGQVPAGYLDLSQRRTEARNAVADESSRAYAAAQQAEQRSDWNTALAQYQRAHDLDPARDVSAELARVKAARTTLGHQLCRDAEAAFALGHNGDARDKFTRVLDLLPSSDDCYAKAKDRLAQINR
jgi:hypothetical protein